VGGELVSEGLRFDWTIQQVIDLYSMDFMELAFQAQLAHRRYHTPGAVQLCTLSNIKRGGCPEDCSYCPQAARYSTDVDAEKLLDVKTVLHQARCAKDTGASRFCMGAAWRQVKNNQDFEDVLQMVEGVAELGMEVCATLGMVTADQAGRLAKAGLTAYNHNIDTSPEYYADIISTRKFDDRLQTLNHVREAGMTVCCGGIVGLGETRKDRAGMLMTLATMEPHPESVPINQLVAVPGTPLAEQKAIDLFEFLRTIAVARVLMPSSFIRLAAGRRRLSDEGQAMAFLLGANSIFFGDELLTTENPSVQADAHLFERLGLTPLEPRC
jgi:biotin synthase